MYYLPKGQGLTIVHTLRRIMLNDLVGVAITAIEWLPHLNELSHINGVKEPVPEILIALKSLRFQTTVNFQNPVKIRLVFFGPGTVYGKYLKLPSFLTLINPDKLIMNITTQGVVDLICYIEQGVGFTNQFEELKNNRRHFLLQNRSLLPIVANFNPVIEANYLLQDRKVESLRFRETMQLVIWDITTNGTMEPFQALVKSSNKASMLFQNVSVNMTLLFDAETRNKHLLHLASFRSKNSKTANRIFLPTFVLEKINLYRTNILNLNKTARTKRRRRLQGVNLFLMKSRRILRTSNQLVVNRK
jgi:DNA-directed RNA polymerase subunit alpha